MSVKKGTSYIAGRAQVDETPVSGSNNAVSSGGVYTALQDKAPASLTASVAALDAALSAKANDNEVVHKNGDETINNTKTFSSVLMSQWASTSTSAYHSGIHMKNVQIANNYSVPDVNRGMQQLFYVNDGTLIGYFTADRTTAGDSRMELCARSRSSSSASNHNVALWVGSRNGTTPITYAPACNANNSIVTTTAHSYARSGYCKLGNGLIIQWGEWNRSTSATITFPTAFSNTNYSIVIIGQNAQRYSWTTGKTSTNCTFNRADDSSQNNDSVSQWIAIGY